MFDFEKVIVELEHMQRRPEMYIQPVTPEHLTTYLSGLGRGIRLTEQALTEDDYRDADSAAASSVGLRSTLPLVQWRKEGLDDNQVIEKLFVLYIAFYRRLSSIQNEK